VLATWLIRPDLCEMKYNILNRNCSLIAGPLKDAK
jgi:hypothetical protein